MKTLTALPPREMEARYCRLNGRTPVSLPDVDQAPMSSSERSATQQLADVLQGRGRNFGVIAW